MELVLEATSISYCRARRFPKVPLVEVVTVCAVAFCPDTVTTAGTNVLFCNVTRPLESTGRALWLLL